jgi:hypothetical protein
MYEPPTEAYSRIRPRPYNDLATNSAAQPFRSSSFAPYDRASGDPEWLNPARAAPNRPSQRTKDRDTDESDLAKRDAICRGVCRAVDGARQMLSAAEARELMDLSNAGFELVKTLESLWQLRGAREENWGDLLNIVQTMLAKVDFETFTRDQCEAILDVLSDYPKRWTVEDDDIEATIERLREGGFDPWRAISGEPEES